MRYECNECEHVEIWPELTDVQCSCCGATMYTDDEPKGQIRNIRAITVTIPLSLSAVTMS